MTARKTFAGARLGEIRRGLGMTQAALGRSLGVSTSYLNQMENNHRPVSRDVVQGLAEKFGIDVSVFSMDEGDRLMADLREAMADPVFPDPPSRAELQILATSAPGMAHSFLALHRAYTRAQERLASLDEALERPESGLSPLPWEEVRDFFHYVDNYLDAVDRAAEQFARTAGFEGRDKVAAGAEWLRARHGIATRFEPGMIRRYDEGARVLRLSPDQPPATQAFQFAHQVALIAHAGLIEATLDLARFRSEEARAIARIGIANYFAGAAILPYGAFLEAARALRHDLEALAGRFGCSLEQVGHRLSTLQRPGARGVPFFFVRVDQAGTITKRHSSTPLQFARFGGACPLWNVHRAFETPGRILRQLAETPDGVRYLCLATDVIKPGGHYRAPTRRYAIGLGCEVKYADQLVYADDLDTANAAAYEPIGISCRICERRACHQRSVPPVEKRLLIDRNARDVLPYAIRR
ncbi:short-chain fatty acyl-CoA regulator family protein [Limibaculum sp. FT325]|uniref:helix-turn-helix domain-containing protein n=1 Tax=Thermohalobaculum sediminis TaxID=2939436 RepID=UPI0020BF034C|nr:helix-turn-helix transcriptional regulator [Limibaculum sediminis]MCL5778050.1 short-chain fatty acyl-CoA regulator family protein [Limibaculum sediminis]